MKPKEGVRTWKERTCRSNEDVRLSLFRHFRDVLLNRCCRSEWRLIRIHNRPRNARAPAHTHHLKVPSPIHPLILSFFWLLIPECNRKPFHASRFRNLNQSMTLSLYLSISLSLSLARARGPPIFFNLRLSLLDSPAETRIFDDETDDPSLNPARTPGPGRSRDKRRSRDFQAPSDYSVGCVDRIFLQLVYSLSGSIIRTRIIRMYRWSNILLFERIFLYAIVACVSFEWKRSACICL